MLPTAVSVREDLVVPNLHSLLHVSSCNRRVSGEIQAVGCVSEDSPKGRRNPETERKGNGRKTERQPSD